MPLTKIRLILTTFVLLLVSSCATQEPDAVPVQESLPAPTMVESDGTVSDGEGNIYPVLQIGDQYWMGANLISTEDRNGNPIDSYCYGDLEDNCQIYGRLYTWEAAMNGSRQEGARGICPEGWHIPSMEEWADLINHIGTEGTAGGKLKEAGFGHWLRSSNLASNDSRMTILPAGWFDFTGEFRGLGAVCFLRSSSSPDPYEVYVWEVRSSSAGVERGSLHPDDAIPLRCIKD